MFLAAACDDGGLPVLEVGQLFDDESDDEEDDDEEEANDGGVREKKLQVHTLDRGRIGFPGRYRQQRRGR